LFGLWWAWSVEGIVVIGENLIRERDESRRRRGAEGEAGMAACIVLGGGGIVFSDAGADVFIDRVQCGEE
jgi:hypothetical protein